MAYTSVFPPTYVDETYVKTTVKYSTSYWGYYAVDPSKLVTGNSSGNAWMTLYRQFASKFNVDLGESRLIRRVYLENFHSSGASSTYGIKDFEVYGALDDAGGAAAFASTDFSNLSDLVLLGQFNAAQHPASDTADPQYFNLSSPGTYRYYIVRTLTNFGGDYLGFRRIQYQLMDDEGSCISPAHSVSGYVYGGGCRSEAHTAAAYTAAISGSTSAPMHSVDVVGHRADVIGWAVSPAHTMDIEFVTNHATVGPFLGDCVQGVQSVSAASAPVVDLTSEAHTVSSSALTGSMASASVTSRRHSVEVVAGAKATVAANAHSMSGVASQVFLATGEITSRVHNVLAEAYHKAIIAGAVTQPLTKVQGTSGDWALCSASLVPPVHRVSGVLSRNDYADGDCVPIIFYSVSGTGRCDSGVSGDVESGPHVVDGKIIDTRYFPILRNNRACYVSVNGSAVSEMHEVAGELRDSALGSMTSEMHEVAGVA